MSFTREFEGAVPENERSVFEVTLSVFDDPVSSAEFRSGLEGEDGLVVSTVIDSGGEAALMLSAESTALAVIEYVPSVRSGSTTLQKVPVELI